MVNIREFNVDVDIARELSKYDWKGQRWTGEKFLACSPFRSERHPSFAVRLDNGIWIDSGTDDETWKKGNLVKLLSWLRNETYEETEEYLLTEYCPMLQADTDKLQLTFRLSLEGQVGPQTLDKKVLTPLLYRHPYLSERRGIGARVQNAFNVGYDKRKRAITLPWFNRAGELVNVKFRSVQDKRFWYYAGGQPIKHHLYGLHMLARVDRARGRRVYITESEIDALTLWEHGIAAIAMGGANLTGRQRELILQSRIEELVIATDNDKAGARIADSINQQLNGYLLLKEVRLPVGVKDINDIPVEDFLEMVSDVNDVSYRFV